MGPGDNVIPVSHNPLRVDGQRPSAHQKSTNFSQSICQSNFLNLVKSQSILITGVTQKHPETKK